MNDVDTRIDARADARHPEQRLASGSTGYRKPTLARLGRWNLFTRTGSFAAGEDEGSGFFQFEVR